MTPDMERLIISVVLVLVGAGLIVYFGETGPLTAAITALWGIVVGWWFPRRNGSANPTYYSTVNPHPPVRPNADPGEAAQKGEPHAHADL